MATQATTFYPTLPFAVLVKMAETAVRSGFVDLPIDVTVTADDLVILNMLVQAAEGRLH